MGNSSSRTDVDDRHLKPWGIYPNLNVDRRVLRKLILDGKLAPFHQPFDVPSSEDMEECPICFMSFRGGLNRANCCGQSVCTECFVQIVGPTGKPNAASSDCPFCNFAPFVVRYHGALGAEQIEARQQEQRDVARMEQRARDDELKRDAAREEERRKALEASAKRRSLRIEQGLDPDEDEDGSRSGSVGAPTAERMRELFGTPPEAHAQSGADLMAANWAARNSRSPLQPGARRIAEGAGGQGREARRAAGGGGGRAAYASEYDQAHPMSAPQANFHQRHSNSSDGGAAQDEAIFGRDDQFSSAWQLEQLEHVMLAEAIEASLQQQAAPSAAAAASDASDATASDATEEEQSDSDEDLGAVVLETDEAAESAWRAQSSPNPLEEAAQRSVPDDAPAPEGIIAHDDDLNVDVGTLTEEEQLALALEMSVMSSSAETARSQAVAASAEAATPLPDRGLIAMLDGTYAACEEPLPPLPLPEPEPDPEPEVVDPWDEPEPVPEPAVVPVNETIVVATSVAVVVAPPSVAVGAMEDDPDANEEEDCLGAADDMLQHAADAQLERQRALEREKSQMEVDDAALAAALHAQFQLEHQASQTANPGAGQESSPPLSADGPASLRDRIAAADARNASQRGY